MGIETAILVALQLASNASKISAARKEASAVVEQGNIDARNKAKQVTAQAGKAKTSFLYSGFSFEGGPSAAVESIYTTGAEDIGNIMRNANTRAKNITAKARTEAITSLVSSAFGASSSLTPTNSFSRAVGNASGFQYGFGGYGGIPTGGFSRATGVPFKFSNG